MTKSEMRIRRANRNVLYVRDISPSVKKLFKAACSRQDETMQDVVEALLRAYMKDPTIANKTMPAVKESRARRNGMRVGN